jgi:hypothetical protein
MYYDPSCRESKTTEQWRTILRQAARYISDRGHCKHAFQQGASVCAIGAMRLAAGVSLSYSLNTKDAPESYLQAIAALNRYLLKTRTKYITIPEWNDAPKRTAADVICALLTAAEAL